MDTNNIETLQRIPENVYDNILSCDVISLNVDPVNISDSDGERKSTSKSDIQL